MRQAGRNLRLKRPQVSPSCVVEEGMREGQSTREAENVRFEEPYGS
jgi:hypothetical protein